MIAERLADIGYQVTQAAAGEQALAELEHFAFDVIVSDLRLPGIDGREVIGKALERYPGIVAIVVTGFGTVKDAVDAIKGGAADFVSKPFQFEELAHVLELRARTAAPAIGERLPAAAARRARRVARRDRPQPPDA